MRCLCKQNSVYTEYAIPVFLCVAGLILVADFWPLEVEWTEGESDYEEELELASSDDKRKATHTKSGAATTSAM